MTIITDPPNVRQIETSREDFFAFEVTGNITAADMENIYGLLEGAYSLHDKIDVLVKMENYEGFDWSAALRETTHVGKTHALQHIRRYAVIGGPAWVTGAIAVFRPFLSLDMRHFAEDEESAAWAWLDTPADTKSADDS